MGGGWLVDPGGVSGHIAGLALVQLLGNHGGALVDGGYSSTLCCCGVRSRGSWLSISYWGLGDTWEGSSQSLAHTWYPDTLEMGKQAVQYNLAVGFALREEWDKSSSIVGQLYKEGKDVPVQVLLLVLYLSLKQGQVDKARRIVRERCPATTRPPDS